MLASIEVIVSHTQARQGQAATIELDRRGIRTAQGRAWTANQVSADVLPIITGLRGDGLTLAAVATELNRQGIQTARGGLWSIMQVSRVLTQPVI